LAGLSSPVKAGIGRVRRVLQKSIFDIWGIKTGEWNTQPALVE